VSSVVLAFAGSGSWTAVATNYTAAPTEVSTSIYPDNTAVGTFWFDDVSLAPTTNLLSNGGFESGAAGWSLASQASIDSNPADAHAGNDSLQLVATGAWEATRQTVTVRPGQTYNFTAWGRSNSGGGVFVLQGHDASGARVSSVVLAFAGSGSWTAVATNYTAAPTEVSTSIYPDNTAAGTFWFDDISLTQN